MRGLPGNPVDRDRHLGFRKLAEAPGNKFEIVEVVGNRDDGTAQKVVADAVAVQKKFDGMFAQAGATGAVRALIDARHEMIPVAAADENGFRKLCASNAKDGLLCTSIVQSPGLVAISMKAAVSALQGKVMPQMISVPVPSTSHPNFKAGTRTDAQTVALMIGRDIEHAYPPKPAARHAAGFGTPLVETCSLAWNNRLHDIDIAVRPGEIVGLGRLDGQGQRESSWRSSACCAA